MADMGLGMSSIGGSIRSGELLNNKPIPHIEDSSLGQLAALQSHSATPGRRWPARLADADAANLHKVLTPR